METELQKGYRAVMPHYYGDTVRKLFLVGAVVILVATPLFAHLFSFSAFLPLFVVILFGIIAGLVSPAQKIVSVLETVISGLAVVGFGIYAVLLQLKPDHRDIHQIILFVLTIVLAINFLFVLYYSVKTLRGHFLKK